MLQLVLLAVLISSELCGIQVEAETQEDNKCGLLLLFVYRIEGKPEGIRLA